jgi:hypothetical protein
VGALAQARLVLNKGDSMARQGKTINVKVPRTKVVKALEQALIKLETDYKNQDTEEKKYNITYKKWEQQVIKLAMAKFNKAVGLKVNARYNGSVNVDFDIPAGEINLPEEPSRNYNSIPEWQYKDSKEEIENAIRVLRMCEDEYINTGTYGNISKYL